MTGLEAERQILILSVMWQGNVNASAAMPDTYARESDRDISTETTTDREREGERDSERNERGGQRNSGKD